MNPAILILLAVLSMMASASCMSCFFVLTQKKKKDDGGGGGGGGGGEQGTGAWKKGYATYYNSYPACCKDSPTYSSSASKSECSDYSGCKYMGQFAGVKGKLSHDEVKQRNIVAFYDDHHQSGTGKEPQAWWNKNAKGKKIEIKNPSSGKTMVVEVLDTCGNHDCPKNGGCCHNNSQKGDGYLLDLEGYTSERFWGKQQNGELQWRWV